MVLKHCNYGTRLQCLSDAGIGKGHTMNKNELIEQVSLQTMYPERTVQNVVEELLRQMRYALGNGEDITIRGFGTFQKKVRAPKYVRNINTGEEYYTGIRSVVVFRPSPKFDE